jgi:hypothetical protein
MTWFVNKIEVVRRNRQKFRRPNRGEFLIPTQEYSVKRFLSSSMPNTLESDGSQSYVVKQVFSDRETKRGEKIVSTA